MSAAIVERIAGLLVAARLVIVNHTPTDLGARADAVLHADVAESLPAIACACIGLKGAADEQV